MKIKYKTCSEFKKLDRFLKKSKKMMLESLNKGTKGFYIFLGDKNLHIFTKPIVKTNLCKKDLLSICKLHFEFEEEANNQYKITK